jgi:hypothetical protein
MESTTTWNVRDGPTPLLVLGEEGFIIANAGAAAESMCKLNRDEGRAAAVHYYDI